MWIYGITKDDIAQHLGVSRYYVSKVMRGERTPKQARERITDAVKELILTNDRQAESSN